MKRSSLLSAILTLTACGAIAYGQTTTAPAAPPPGIAKPPAAAASNGTGAPARIAVIDFNQAVVANGEGKVAYQKFQTAVGEKQKGLADKQKSLDDIQTKLRTQDKTLSDAAKADYNKQIDLINTDMTRMNEDAQRDLGELQQQLFAPIAGRVRTVMEGYAKEMGFALVFDTSTQNSNMVYFDPVADITTEVIRRVDADAAKNPTRPLAPAGAPGRVPATGAPARGTGSPVPAAPKAPPQY